MMLLQLVMLLIVSLPSCSFLPKDLNPMPSPLMPAQVAASVAVVIEDHYEDPVCDLLQTSPIEAIADALAGPWNFLMTVVAFEGSLDWGLVDVVSNPSQQPDFAQRFQQIRQWVPIHFAGVEPPLEGKQPIATPACART
jgi:hypothetical protein